MLRELQKIVSTKAIEASIVFIAVPSFKDILALLSVELAPISLRNACSHFPEAQSTGTSSSRRMSLAMNRALSAIWASDVHRRNLRIILLCPGNVPFGQR